MGYLNILNFDFSSFMELLKEIGLRIIELPVKLFSKLPPWFKTAFLIFIIVCSVAIAIWWWKNRE